MLLLLLACCSSFQADDQADDQADELGTRPRCCCCSCRAIALLSLFPMTMLLPLLLLLRGKPLRPIRLFEPPSAEPLYNTERRCCCCICCCRRFETCQSKNPAAADCMFALSLRAVANPDATAATAAAVLGAMVVPAKPHTP
jgi:hypothetical protein